MRYTLLTTSLVLALAGVASAQTYAQPAAGYGLGYGEPGYGYGYFSSTYEEGVLRGAGYYAQAVGQANYLNSLAAINNQQAYSKFLDNREKRTETYFHLKQINRAARDAQQPSRLSTEQYAVIAKKQAPDRLSEVDYNRALGRLSWPATLAGSDFAAEREMLDKLFAARSPNDSGVGSKFHTTVRQLTSTMQSRLPEQLSTMSPMEFIAAKKFLTGLAYESQQPLAPPALAFAE